MTVIRRLAPFAAVFLAINLAVRLSLALRAGPDVLAAPGDWPRILALGLWFDLVVFGAFALLPALWWLLLPGRLHGGRLDRTVTAAGFFLFVALLGFTAIGEELFWSEFSSRYNFIAVDYLVYTQEVIGNIRESYPVLPLLAGLAAAVFGIFAAAVAILQLATDDALAERGANVLADEIAKNGTHALFHAFLNNEIDYERFYRTEPAADVTHRMRRLLAGAGSRFEADGSEDLTRLVAGRPGGTLRKNVVFVVMESMGAEYTAHFGDRRGLTPELDHLADDGLLFTHAYATGTRTVRGLEALTLSVPPTPGQSIVRRPGNGGLFSIGGVFADLGYDRRFVYGGFGYFDNMNAFYRDNGFITVDRTDMDRDRIRFANVWGVSDEDLFDRVIAESDASHRAGRPFLSIVMTTSNHRPYTFPEGAIDLPQGTRASAVKYADHAIGRFVAAARQKDWFADTIFVFLADHTAGSAGKVELALEKYRIPVIVYAPGFVAPRQVDAPISQIDVAPTVLGLIGHGYRSRFYGQDALAPAAKAAVFVSTYQKVGLVRDGAAAILEPNRKVSGIVDGQPVAEAALPPELIGDAIAYYQYAAHWKKHSSAIPTRQDEGPQSRR